jgi:hypothetical protein
MKWFTNNRRFAILAALVAIWLIALAMAGCSDDRAKHAADARSGLHAAAELAPETGAILAGVDARLPAVAGVNSADWPAPEWTKDRVRNDPQGYGKSAPPEPARWGWVAALGGAGVAAIGLLRLAAPLIPGGGPILKMAADFAWTFLTTKDQKKADAAAATTLKAAVNLSAILASVRDLPPGTLPDHVQQLLAVPLVQAAIDHIAAEAQKATT